MRTVGQYDGNLLIQGDAITAMDMLLKTHAGAVKLIYIDPPFNTKKDQFEHYDDVLSTREWKYWMRDCLKRIHQLLSDDGSIWLHLDDHEMHTGRLLLDEVFGRKHFLATIVWQRKLAPDQQAAFSRAHEYIHVYSKGHPPDWKKVSRNKVEGLRVAKHSNPDNDPRGPWRSMTLKVRSLWNGGLYPITTPTGVVHTPPFRNCSWRMIESSYKALLDDGRIHFPDNGNGQPVQKYYECEYDGLVVPETWWTGQTYGTSARAKKHMDALIAPERSFATPKPEELIERVLHIGSNPGDLVFDCFGGSGTTAATAHKMGRRWITAECEPSTIETFVLPRLQKIVDGNDPGGVTEKVGWAGGGGFAVITTDELRKGIHMTNAAIEPAVKVRHPARYSKGLLPLFSKLLADHVPKDEHGQAIVNLEVLDPMAGTGRIHELQDMGPYWTTGVEIEPEWANMHERTVVGNALSLPFDDYSFDAVVTSPTYGNRMADHHVANDGSTRRSYTHDLGRELHPDNSGAMQWGKDYRKFHRDAWKEVHRVLRPGGLFLLNVKDHIRGGKRQYVAGWHVTLLCSTGFRLLHHVEVETRGLPVGENAEVRMPTEMVYVFVEATK